MTHTKTILKHTLYSDQHSHYPSNQPMLY